MGEPEDNIALQSPLLSGFSRRVTMHGDEINLTHLFGSNNMSKPEQAGENAQQNGGTAGGSYSLSVGSF